MGNPNNRGCGQSAPTRSGCVSPGDIHDSVGQSLAFVAFKLDRLAGMAEDEKMHDELDGLRTEVRWRPHRGVRDTLCDLRTDVTHTRELVGTLRANLERVSARADFEGWLDTRPQVASPWCRSRRSGAWPMRREQRRASRRARHLRVHWECDGRSGHLTVADDGKGFDVERGGRTGSYGLQGMRERANAIGARLEIGPDRRTARSWSAA